jgi:hypothetical protein
MRLNNPRDRLDRPHHLIQRRYGRTQLSKGIGIVLHRSGNVGGTLLDDDLLGLNSL